MIKKNCFKSCRRKTKCLYLRSHKTKCMEMELQILVSRKGTKVVLASALYLELQLPKANYQKALRRWIKDCYSFSDGIRQAEPLKDFAKRKGQPSLLEDYYLSLEFARHIALATRSRKKMQVARWLLGMERDVPQMVRFSEKERGAIRELAKAMGFLSCQMACERQHLKVFEAANGGNAANWWQFRSKLLGYSTDYLREIVRKTGGKTTGKSQRQLLMLVDKYEMVRTGVIDFFMALGKQEQYARSAGDLAKALATQMGVEIYDDRSALPNLYPAANAELVQQLCNVEPRRLLKLWNNHKMAS